MCPKVQNVLLMLSSGNSILFYYVSILIEHYLLHFIIKEHKHPHSYISLLNIELLVFWPNRIGPKNFLKITQNHKTRK